MSAIFFVFSTEANTALISKVSFFNFEISLTKLSFLTVNPNAENSPGVRNWEVLIEHRKQMERMIPKRRSTS